MKTMVLAISFLFASMNILTAQDLSMASVNEYDVQNNSDDLTYKVSSPVTTISFVAYSRPDLKGIKADLAGTHTLGNEVAKYKYLFTKTYSYQTEVGPGNTGTRTVIKKPLIYNAVCKLEKYYKKAARKKVMPEKQAIQELNQCYLVAYVAFTEETQQLESAIKEQKTAKGLADLFQQVSVVYN
ncbi:MAG: hypothetical protein N4A74_07335 [Carboxylicivirga sp.]|jgi:hypothetical protein|nr:hypothetical protein [Carboxylicivirga sp.]